MEWLWVVINVSWTIAGLAIARALFAIAWNIERLANAVQDTRK